MIRAEFDSSNAAEAYQLALGYGKSRIPSRYDPERFEVLFPADASHDPLTDARLSELISAPTGSTPESSAIRGSSPISLWSRRRRRPLRNRLMSCPMA
jgi:hypothetical protein